MGRSLIDNNKLVENWKNNRVWQIFKKIVFLIWSYEIDTSLKAHSLCCNAEIPTLDTIINYTYINGFVEGLIRNSFADIFGFGLTVRELSKQIYRKNFVLRLLYRKN